MLICEYFLEDKRRSLNTFVTEALDRFAEDNDEEGEFWSREMNETDMNKLVKRITSLPYPLENGRGHNTTVLRAVVYDVKGYCERSSSRSSSKSAAASDCSTSPTKKLPVVVDTNKEEDEVVPKHTKRKAKKRA
jgi:hypothetical protein